jgi:hypothetical protein
MSGRVVSRSQGVGVIAMKPREGLMKKPAGAGFFMLNDRGERYQHLFL